MCSYCKVRITILNIRLCVFVLLITKDILMKLINYYIFVTEYFLLADNLITKPYAYATTFN
jgi:hypothetical protein